MLDATIDSYKEAVRKKQLIKAGFEKMREQFISPTATKFNLNEMEFAFMI